MSNAGSSYGNGGRVSVRRLSLPDALRCAATGQPHAANRACALTALASEKPFGLTVLSAALDDVALALVADGKPLAIASASRRSAAKCWEITRLFAPADVDALLPDMLEGAAVSAAKRGCERIVLRLRYDDPLVDVARRGGYFPRISQTLFRRDGALERKSTAAHNAIDASMRKRARSDDYALFRLYNAATPLHIRTHVGMSIDQWLAWRERAGRSCAEFICERDGAAIGGARLFRISGVWALEVEAHPDYAANAAALLDFGLARIGTNAPVICLAAAHQEPLANALIGRGFERRGEFISVIKVMPLTVRDGVRVRVGAHSV